MSKFKGSKNFMTLSKKECLTVSNHLLKNAECLYNDAQLLEKNKSYGRATTMLIHSTEETMKAFILFLDGNGFEFRNNVKGINNLFVNHSLRYGLAMVISLLHIISEDLKKFIIKARNEPDAIISLCNDKSNFDKMIKEFMEHKINIFNQEVIWFSKLEFLRQEGLYVDYIDEILTPLNFEEDDYNEVLTRYIGLNYFVKVVMESFEIKEERHIEYLNKFRIKFLDENWYKYIGLAIYQFKCKKNPLEKLSKKINDFLIDLKSSNV